MRIIKCKICKCEIEALHSRQIYCYSCKKIARYETNKKFNKEYRRKYYIKNKSDILIKSSQFSKTEKGKEVHRLANIRYRERKKKTVQLKCILCKNIIEDAKRTNAKYCKECKCNIKKEYSHNYYIVNIDAYKDRSKRYCENLSNAYLNSQLKHRYSSKIEDCPIEIIDFTREHIRLKRLIKELQTNQS